MLEMRRVWLFLIFIAPIAAQTVGPDLFESKIRPVLAAKCYACHSSKLKSPMGGFALDTKAGLQKGGSSGLEVVPRKPQESRLLQALRYTDAHLQMPPSGKLPDNVIQDFDQWIAAGAIDPRVDSVAPGSSAAAPPRKLDIEKGRAWWAYQPVRETPTPTVQKAAWPRTKIDNFILSKLEANKLQPSSPADARTLIRRVTLDLTGLAPSYEEIEAFARDSSPDAYERLVDRLLTSPHYGERWGRYWLDVARYADDNPNNLPSIPFFPYAWRYRDWVTEALNKDIGYNRFVTLQIAADKMPGVSRDDWRALGYMGIGPLTHKDSRLSAEVIETFAADDWDERVDTLSRGLLGMTVACARCHDHKFDPIATKDYYALAGVFASSSAVVRPLFEIEPETEKRFLWIEQRLLQLDYLVALLSREPGSDPEGSARKVARFKVEIDALMAEVKTMGERYPELPKQIEKYTASSHNTAGKIRPVSDEAPFSNAVYDAGLWIDGTDPELSVMDFKPGKARDLNVFIRGNVANRGELAPRALPAVLHRTDAVFHEGSGRLELADGIFKDAAPLAARVMVNRVWGWHFGKSLVTTPSDFGTQGDKPSHPELLDDLASRFIAHGWSLKWLHREIVLSAAYRQASHPRPEGDKADPANRLLWRVNPRRLDVEAFRDSLLSASGSLNQSLYGPSINLDAPDNKRRTTYGQVSREDLNTVLQLYDVPNAAQHIPARDLTTTPLQQLFVLNSSFVQEQAQTLAESVKGQADGAPRVRALYRKILRRDPDPEEIDLGLSYLNRSSMARYAQALLATDEFIFWE